MSNVAVANDSLQMSQQLARSSKQRGWQGGFESRGRESTRMCERRYIRCACVCVSVRPHRTVRVYNLNSRPLHYSRTEITTISKEACTARNPGGGVCLIEAGTRTGCHLVFFSFLFLIFLLAFGKDVRKIV